jgi:hypothetical protein
MIDQSKKAMALIEQLHKQKTLRHSIRVAYMAIEGEDPTIEDWIFQVGLLHDLLEDTDYTAEQLAEDGFAPAVIKAVQILTKSKDEDYGVYIGRIFDSGNHLAIRVKRADMKDHLMRTETLTDKLKEKYLPHIWKFL